MRKTLHILLLIMSSGTRQPLRCGGWNKNEDIVVLYPWILTTQHILDYANVKPPSKAAEECDKLADDQRNIGGLRCERVASKMHAKFKWGAMWQHRTTSWRGNQSQLVNHLHSLQEKNVSSWKLVHASISALDCSANDCSECEGYPKMNSQGQYIDS